MTAEQLWRQYLKKHPESEGAKYEAWQYGSDDPDELLRLTMEGTKTATASAYACYLYENCPPPKQGDFSVILNSADEAKCVIQTVKASVVPFAEVSAEQAYKEGEGDRSLTYWREVHEEVFTKELQGIGQTFDDTMLVICEEFVVRMKA